jgi:hypothetical protein
MRSKSNKGPYLRESSHACANGKDSKGPKFRVNVSSSDAKSKTPMKRELHSIMAFSSPLIGINVSASYLIACDDYEIEGQGDGGDNMEDEVTVDTENSGTIASDISTPFSQSKKKSKGSMKRESSVIREGCYIIDNDGYIGRVVTMNHKLVKIFFGKEWPDPSDTDFHPSWALPRIKKVDIQDLPCSPCDEDINNFNCQLYDRKAQQARMRNRSLRERQKEREDLIQKHLQVELDRKKQLRHDNAEKRKERASKRVGTDAVINDEGGHVNSSFNDAAHSKENVRSNKEGNQIENEHNITAVHLENVGAEN